MTHIYSVKIQNYISEKLAVAAERKKAAEKQNDFETRQFYEGQLKELLTFRKYLTENLFHQLCRRVFFYPFGPFGILTGKIDIDNPIE